MVLPWGFMSHFIVLSVSLLAMLVLSCGSRSEGKLKALLFDRSASYCPFLLLWNA